MDITEQLQAGDNAIEITLIPTCRNLLVAHSGGAAAALTGVSSAQRMRNGLLGTVRLLSITGGE